MVPGLSVCIYRSGTTICNFTRSRERMAKDPFSLGDAQPDVKPTIGQSSPEVSQDPYVIAAVDPSYYSASWHPADDSVFP